MKKKIINSILIFILLSSVVLCFTGCELNKNNSNSDDNSQNNESEKTYSLDSNDSFYVMINGTKFVAGDKISSVSKVNLKLRDKDLDENIPKNRYLMAKPIINSDNKEVCKFVALNSTDNTIKYSDAVIGGFEVGDINFSKLSSETLALNIEVAGGLKLGSSYEDIVKVFGEPHFKNEFKADEKYKRPAYTVYTYSKGYKGYKFIVDDSGKVSQIEWTNYSYNR